MKSADHTTNPAAPETTTTPADIERLAAAYSDLPREALVKEDLLRLGVAFSPAALRLAAGKKSKSYFIFSFDRVPIESMEQRENLQAPEEIALEGGPWRFRRTIVSVRVNPASPYRVEAAAGEDGAESTDTAADSATGAGPDAYLTLGGSRLTGVHLPEPPAYYARRLAGGRPITEVAPCIEWGYLIYLTVFRRCQYFGRDEECRFCDINENYRQQQAAGRPYVTVKQLDEVIEAMSIIHELDGESRAYTVTGGAVTDQLRGMNEAEFYARFTRAIEERFPRRWISKMVTQALPLDQVRLFHDAGVQIYHPNYEIWDAQLFETICPGKARTIGHREWVERIERAAAVFGPSHVIPNFVGGVEMAKPHGFETVEEALASTGAGLEHFMSQGIVPRFTTWCAEPLSDLGSYQGPAPLEYHAGLLRVWRDTHRRHRLPAPPGYGPPGVGRAVFSVSAFMDVIDPETEVAPV